MEAPDQMNNLAIFVSHMLEDAHELTTSQVAHLATPHGLHTLHIQVFKEEIVEIIRQFVRKLEKPVAALIDDRLVDASDNHLGFLPATREFNFTSKILLGNLQFSHSLAKVQRAFNIFSNIGNQESFQTKVKPGTFTCPELIILVGIFLYHEVEPEIAKAITFDRNRLDVCWNIARLTELIDHPLNLDPVPIEKFPTRLLEGETGVLLDFFEAWRRCADLVLEIAKEKLIALIDALNNVLNRLTAYQIPMGVLGKLFQLGDVLHQDKLIQALPRQLVVATVQGDAVIVDQPCNVNLLVQKTILFLAIELEFVRPHRCNYTIYRRIMQLMNQVSESIDLQLAPRVPASCALTSP
jgi:hypothetical protein